MNGERPGFPKEEEDTIKRIKRESNENNLWKNKSEDVDQKRLIDILNSMNRNVLRDQIVPSNF